MEIERIDSGPSIERVSTKEPTPLFSRPYLLENLGRNLAGTAEAITSLATMGINWIPAGLKFFADAPVMGVDAAAAEARKLQEMSTYQPQFFPNEAATPLAAAAMPFKGYQLMAPIAGQAVQDVTGSPATATAVHTAIEGLPFLIPFGEIGVKNIGPLVRDSAWYRGLSIKERSVVMKASKGIEADIEAGTLTGEQVRNLWKDPANREALLKKYQGVNKSPATAQASEIKIEPIKPAEAIKPEDIKIEPIVETKPPVKESITPIAETKAVAPEIKIEPISQTFPASSTATEAAPGGIAKVEAGEPLPSTNQPTEVLHKFEDKANGVEVHVAKITDGYSVAIKDTDSGQFLNTVYTAPTEAAAIKKAETIVKPEAPKDTTGVANIEPMTSREGSKSERVRNGLNKMIENRIKLDAAEAQGRDILDTMDENNRSPKDAANEFWDKTYWKLSGPDQAKFQKQVKGMTGMEPGSILWYNPDTKETGIAKDWVDVAKNHAEDLPSSVEHLEGTERGYVSLMEYMNQKVGESKPDLAPTSVAPVPVQTSSKKLKRPTSKATNLVTRIKELGGLKRGVDYSDTKKGKFQKTGKNRELEFPDVKRVANAKTGVPIDEMVQMLNGEGFNIESTDALMEALRTGQGRNIFTPENSDAKIEQQLRRQEHDWIEEQLATLEAEGIDAGRTAESSQDLHAEALSEIKAQGFDIPDEEAALKEISDFFSEVSKPKQVKPALDAPTGNLAGLSPAETFGLTAPELKENTGVLTKQVTKAKTKDIFAPEAPATKPKEATPTTANKPAEQIQDFGEKIGGARKDTAESGYTIAGKAKQEETGPVWRKRYVAVESVRNPGQWSILDTKVKVSYGNTQTFPSQEAAESAIPLYAVAKNHRVYQGAKDAGYSIYKEVSDRKRIKVINQEFPSREDAMKYMAEHAEEILNIKTSFGEEILPVPEIAHRKGVERRTKDATPEMFASIIGNETGSIDLRLLVPEKALQYVQKTIDDFQKSRVADHVRWMMGQNEPDIKIMLAPKKHGPQLAAVFRNMESVLSQTKEGRNIYEAGREFKEKTPQEFEKWRIRARKVLDPLSTDDKLAVLDLLDTTEEITGTQPVEVAAAKMRELMTSFREWMIDQGQNVGFIEGYLPHIFQGKFWVKTEGGGEYAHKVNSLDAAIDLAKQIKTRTGKTVTIMEDTFIPPDDATMLTNRGYWRLVKALQKEMGESIPVLSEEDLSQLGSKSAAEINKLLRENKIARPKPKKRFFGNMQKRASNNPNFIKDIDKVMDLYFYGGVRKVYQDVFMRKYQSNIEKMPMGDSRLKTWIEAVYLPGVLAHPTNFEEGVARVISDMKIMPGVNGQDIRKIMHNVNLVQYVYDLGLSASSAVANASQFFINVYPIVGEQSAAVGYYKAARTFTNDTLLQEIEDMGISSGVSSMTGQALLGKGALRKFARQITFREGVKEFGDATLVMFTGIEMQNRFAAYWAGKDYALRNLNKGKGAVELAKKVAPKTSSLMDMAKEYDARMSEKTKQRNATWWKKTRKMREELARQSAFELNDKTNFRVGRENLPQILREAPVRIFAPYKSFLMNQLKYTLDTLAPKGLITDPKKALRFAAMSFALGGILGNPLLYAVFLGIAALYKALFDRDLEKEVERRNLKRGLTGALGIDISGSVAIQLPSQALDLLGRYGKIGVNLGKLAMEKSTTGHTSIFTERTLKRQLQPAQLQRTLDAMSMLKEGEYTSPIKGTVIKLKEPPWKAAVKRFVGIMPGDVTKTFDKEERMNSLKIKYKAISGDMTERLATAIKENNPEAIKAVQERLSKSVNKALEQLKKGTETKNNELIQEAITDLLFWRSWMDSRPKFREALERKYVDRSVQKIERLPKYLKPAAVSP